MSLRHLKANHLICSFLVSVALPAFILMKLSDESHLGPWAAFFLALSFPLLFSIGELCYKNHVHWISILGMMNVLITGGFGLVRLDGIWFAVKEATVPLVIGSFILVSQRWRKPLIHRLVMNKAVFNVELMLKGISAHQAEKPFEILLKKINLLIAASFFLSSFLNFSLAYIILQSPVGTSEFNKELAHMQLLSYPVIVLPSLAIASIALMIFLRTLTHLTGYKLEELLMMK